MAPNKKQELPGVEMYLSRSKRSATKYSGRGGQEHGCFLTLEELKEFARECTRNGRHDYTSLLYFDERWERKYGK